MCGNYFNLVLQMMKSRFRMVVCMQLLSDVLLFGLYSIPWILAPKAPLSMEFFRKEYWSKLPSPTSVALPSPGIEPASRVSCIGRWILYHYATWKTPIKMVN